MTAPKRIIMDFGYTPTADGVALLETWSKPVEYTRTDLIQPMIDKAVAEAWVEGMRAAMDALDECYFTPDNDREEGHHEGITARKEAIRALITREGG